MNFMAQSGYLCALRSREFSPDRVKVRTSLGRNTNGMVDTRDTVDVTFTIEQGGAGFSTVCSCGWRSVRLATAGMAGAQWDRHRADNHSGAGRL
jgi:hypothetical protein